MLRIIVNERGDPVKAEVIREDSVVIRVTVSVDTRLEAGDYVSVFRRGNRAKKDSRAIPRGKKYSS